LTPTDWYILLLSALPVTELRFTIPLAIMKFEMGALRAFILAVLGNLLPVVPILLLLDPLSRLLRYFSPVDRIFQRILQASRRKGKQVEKYGLIGLLLFVSVPAPGTGAWTGAIIAWLLGFNRLYSSIVIGLGVIVAGTIVTLASIGVLQAAVVYDLELVLAVLLVLGALYLYLQFRKKKKNR